MRAMTAMALVLLAVASAAAQPAAPPTVTAVFRAFDLFGTWAADCSRPAAPDNPHVIDVEVSPGIVLERQDLGPDHRVNTYSILKAKRLSKTEVALEVIFEPGRQGEQRQHLVMRVQEGTRRTLFNQPVGGPVRVKDGVAVGYGLKTQTLRKCE